MRPMVFGLVALTLETALVAGGCASQPSRFYLLSAMPNTEMASPEAPGEKASTIAIGSVTIPRYLDRPQIVTRTSLYELRVAEFDRWAEALDLNFACVLAENLALQVPTARVVAYPWPRAIPIDYQVIVDVTHFLTHVGGESLLIADWVLFKGERQHVLMTGKSHLRASAAGQDYAAIVAVMSQTVASLSREIATAVKAVGPRVSARRGFSGKSVRP